MVECVCVYVWVDGCMYSYEEDFTGGVEKRSEWTVLGVCVERRGCGGKCHSRRKGGVRITSIKITDQISIELKQTRTREGHYIMYCVDFFFHTSYCVTQGLTSMYLCVFLCSCVVCVCVYNVVVCVPVPDTSLTCTFNPSMQTWENVGLFIFFSQQNVLPKWSLMNWRPLHWELKRHKITSAQKQSECCW